MKYPVITPQQTPGDTKWFQHDRFGLFIHWGLYSLAARHEWVKSREEMDTQTYDKYFQHFDPDLYDPRLWAAEAKNAGMKYFVVTTKHHEGFCLWDTKYTTYKSTNTPFGRDVLTPMVDAFRDEDMKVGFYHSLLDWHHPDYRTDMHHPMRNDSSYVAADKERNMDIYADYLYHQTEELVSAYRPDIFWYDFSVRGDSAGRFLPKGKDVWKSQRLIELIRGYNKDIILNDRLDIDQDVKTPEQFQPRKWLTVDGKPIVWEACQTLSGSWGYYRDEYSWKSVDVLVQMLIDTVSKGGNLLLNVGPTGRGEFDERALAALHGIGEWMLRHNRSIYGCTQAPEEFQCPQDCRMTYNPQTNRLYVHIFSWPFAHLHLDGFAGKVAYAQLLNDASEIIMTEHTQGNEAIETITPQSAAGSVTLNLPIRKPNVVVPVIELFLK